MTHLPVEAFGELNPFQLREKKALEILWELFLQYKMKFHLHPNFNVHINVDLVSTKIGHIANEKLNSSMHYQVCMSKFFRLLIIIRCSKKVANKVMVYHWKYKIMKYRIITRRALEVGYISPRALEVGYLALGLRIFPALEL